MRRMLTAVVFAVLFASFAIVFCVPSRAQGSGNVDPKIAPYVGDWVGHGYSWETRFRQSRKDFARQLTGGRVESIEGERSKVEGNVMEVAVEHDTEFAFTVDEKGQIKGKGAIVYNVSPNLCGLAALTKQVNEAIDMMAKLPEIYKFANEIGTAYVNTMNKEWIEKENELSESVNGLASHEFKQGPTGTRVNKEEKEELEQLAKERLDKMSASNDTRALAYQSILNRCAQNPSAAIVGGYPCDMLSLPAVSKKAEGLEKTIADKVFESAKEKINGWKDEQVKKYYTLNKVEQEADNTCGAVGPKNAHEYTELMKEKFTDIAKENWKNPISEGTVGSRAAMMLQVPGVTQVAYYYKGLAHGPEKRTFNITGYVDPGGQMYLKMDGDPYDGPKQLEIQYMVNYKWDHGYFPVWSPFLSGPGHVKSSGTVTAPPKHKLQASGSGEAGVGKATPNQSGTAMTFNTPVAVFEEKGTHRNGVAPWQEYEYFWYAHQVTQTK